MQSDAGGAVVRQERSSESRGARIVGIAVVTLVSALVTMALGQKIWTAPPGASVPPAGLVPFFIMLELAGDLLFGLGVSFVIFGYGLLVRARQPLWLTYATYVSIAWLMLSWWPHGNLHRVTPSGAWLNLLYIDYGFHLSLMVGSAIVALFFIRTLSAVRD